MPGCSGGGGSAVTVGKVVGGELVGGETGAVAEVLGAPVPEGLGVPGDEVAVGALEVGGVLVAGVLVAGDVTFGCGISLGLAVLVGVGGDMARGGGQSGSRDLAAKSCS